MPITAKNMEGVRYMLQRRVEKLRQTFPDLSEDAIIDEVICTLYSRSLEAMAIAHCKLAQELAQEERAHDNLD